MYWPAATGSVFHPALGSGISQLDSVFPPPGLVVGAECDGGPIGRLPGVLGELADLQDHLPGQELLHGGQEHQAEEGSLGENYREGREGREL